MATTNLTDEAIEAAAEASHNAYEDAAQRFGWGTQERSRVPWPHVPPENQATVRVAIRAAIMAAMPAIRESIAQEIEIADGPGNPMLSVATAARIVRGGQ